MNKLSRWNIEHDLDIRSVEKTPRELLVRKSSSPRTAASHPHTHHWGQLLYASSGLMRANSIDGSWIIPAHRAAWIPPNTLHDVEFVRPTSMINVYISNSVTTGLPSNCCIIGVSPLLRELIAEVARFPALYDVDGAEGRMVRVLLDQLTRIRESAFHLPFPQDKQLIKITRAIQATPSDNRSLNQWAQNVGSSSRTLARKFQKETRMSFTEWRQQARLIAAVIRLADGAAVNLVAEELGYSSQSAFTNMFRKATGKTPARYFNADAQNDTSGN